MGWDWGEGLTIKLQERIIKDDGYFPYLDCDGGYITLSICKHTANIH